MKIYILKDDETVKQVREDAADRIAERTDEVLDSLARLNEAMFGVPEYWERSLRDLTRENDDLWQQLEKLRAARQQERLELIDRCGAAEADARYWKARALAFEKRALEVVEHDQGTTAAVPENQSRGGEPA